MKQKTEKNKKDQNHENKEQESEPIGRSKNPLLILVLWVFCQVCYYPQFCSLLYPLFLPLLPPGSPMPPAFPLLIPRPKIPRMKKRSKNGKKHKNRKKRSSKRRRRKPDHILNCNNVPILAVHWTAGFLLSSKGKFNSEAFRIFLWLREREHPDVPIAIHGFWLLLKRNGKNVRRPDKSITEDDLKGVEDDLLKYLNGKPERVGYLDTYWPDFHYWSPIAWETEPLDHNWKVKVLRFRIVVLEFLRHGRPMGLNLSQYIERTIEEFDRIMLSHIIRNSTNFPTSTGRTFSLGFPIRFTESAHLISDLENSLGKRPLLIFRKYTSPTRNKDMCSLCEFKFAFSLRYDGQDIEFILEDQPSHTKCEAHPGLPQNTSHKCVVLSHHDRWTLQD